MSLTKVFNRMNGSVYSSAGDVPAGLAVGITITIAGIDKVVVASGQDETVNGNLLRNLVSGNVTVREKSAAYTAVVIDSGALIRSTATMTLSLTAAATLGSGWFVDVLASTGTFTIDPDGAETIDGATTIDLLEGQSARIYSNGVLFFTTSLTIYLPDKTGNARKGLRLNAAETALEYTVEPTGFVGADIVSASAIVHPEDGDFNEVTGTTNIDTITGGNIGDRKTFRFKDALTINQSANIKLPNNTNIKTFLNYIATFRKVTATNWILESDSHYSIEKIGTDKIVATSVATVDFVPVQGVDENVFHFNNVVPATNAVDLVLRISDDNQSTFENWVNSTSGPGSSSPTIISNIGSGATDVGICGTVTIRQLSGMRVSVFVKLSYFDAGNGVSEEIAAWEVQTTMAITDFQVKFSAGDVESGELSHTTRTY